MSDAVKLYYTWTHFPPKVFRIRSNLWTKMIADTC
jgi:hypothetical protein